METIVTGAGGIIGGYIVKQLGATPIFHDDCDLTEWSSVEKCPYEADSIVNCAFVGKYGEDYPGSIEKNISIITNLRRRWPKAKLISMGSGAMYDKSKSIVKVKEYDKAVYPNDSYGLTKRLIVDLSDVTLIPFGLYADTRFVGMVKRCIEKGTPVPIIQDVKFTWVTLDDLTKYVKWAIKDGGGRVNVGSFDATLTEIAKKLGAKEFTYLKPGMANEYTAEYAPIR